MVMAAEVVNTAIEAVVDMSTNYYHPLAKIAKKCRVGAVLITAINAVIVGYVIFWDKLTNISYVLVHKVKNSQPYTVLIILVIVTLATIIVKAIFWRRNSIKREAYQVDIVHYPFQLQL